MRRIRFALVLLAVALARPLPAGPQGPGEAPAAGASAWRFDGSIAGRFEHYDVSGDSLQSPFRFTGWQPYGELNLNLEHRFNPYHRLRGQFLGIVNDNDYRSAFDGVVVERATVAFENGSTRLPYRLDVGDSFAYISQRTVQRSLKGVQFELQAPLAGSVRQSFQFLSGLYKGSWRELGTDQDVSTGVSWLVDAPRRGRISVAYLFNSREANDFRPQLDQNLFSVAGQVYLADRRASLEGEIGRLEETSGGDASDRSDEAYFLQLQNGPTRMPLLYRLRFERYGADYRPPGAPIVSGRRSGEAYVGWRFASGLELRGRLQAYRDFFESANPFDNNTYGVSLRGPMLRNWTSGLSGSFDFFIQDIENRLGTTDTVAATFIADLAKSIGGVWTPRLRYFFQDSDDGSPRAFDQRINELRFGFDRAVTAGGFTGAIGPGFLMRFIDKSFNQGTNYFPTVGVNLARGPHSFRQDFGFEDLNRDDRLTTDVGTFSYHLLYRYAMRRNDLGFEFDSINRNPDPGTDTDSYRFAGYWVHHFDFLGGGAGGATPAPGAPAAAIPQAGAGSGAVDLAELVPGASFDSVIARLKRGGIADPVQLGNLYNFVTSTLLNDVSQRQRVVLIQDGEALDRAALIIDGDEFGGDTDFLLTFERVRRTFIDRYGSPTNVYEAGVIGPEASLGEAVNRGDLARVTEWSKPGGLLRFGIPRRLDGRLTMELQFAKSLPIVTDPRWSIADARR